MSTTSDGLLTQHLDKLEIADLAQRERVARDARDWDGLLDCYHPESLVQTSWFKGAGAEFVASSKERVGKPGGSTFHVVGPTLVTLDGERAIADTGCVIHLRKEIAGAVCDIATYCRHRSRVERRDGRWRLVTLIGIYQKDTLIPTDPRKPPVLDEARLARYRESYRYISYLNAELSGMEPPMDRPGMDRPELTGQWVSADLAWLAGSD